MKSETSINYKKIVDDVLEKISRGELQKGDKLPTELCLATKFEVSRTCVREAIKSLEAMGIVQSIQGSGSYITNTPEQSINRPLCALFALSNGTLENVLDLRNVLETDVCRDIIRTASDDEIARLCALADYDYNEPPIKQQALLDSRFHNAAHAHVAQRPHQIYLHDAGVPDGHLPRARAEGNMAAQRK